MYKKVVFDSDGLIKLVKAGLPKNAFNFLKAYISDDVYREAVLEGKKGLYKEAFEIESLITENKIIKKKIKVDKNAVEMLENFNFGKGEDSSLHLFFNIKSEAIVSDGKKFLNFLFDNKIPFILPVDLVANLQEKNVINKTDALSVLEGLKPFIKINRYLEAKKKLEDKK